MLSEYGVCVAQYFNVAAVFHPSKRQRQVFVAVLQVDIQLFGIFRRPLGGQHVQHFYGGYVVALCQTFGNGDCSMKFLVVIFGSVSSVVYRAVVYLCECVHKPFFDGGGVYQQRFYCGARLTCRSVYRGHVGGYAVFGVGYHYGAVVFVCRRVDLPLRRGVHIGVYAAARQVSVTVQPECVKFVAGGFYIASRTCRSARRRLYALSACLIVLLDCNE